MGFFSKPSGSCGNSFVSTGVWLMLVGVFSEGRGVATSSLAGWGLWIKTKSGKPFLLICLPVSQAPELAKSCRWAVFGSTHAVEGCRMRSEICLESWWELRTIMLCSVAGCCGMLMLMAPTFTTAALLVFRPLWALYRAWDLAMLHFTTVLTAKENSTHLHALPVTGETELSVSWILK